MRPEPAIPVERDDNEEKDPLKIKYIRFKQEKRAMAFSEVPKYPYPRFQLFLAGVPYDDTFSKFDLDKVNKEFKLLSVGGQQYARRKYLGNVHKDKEKEPLKYPNFRFQLCSAKVSVDNYSARNETLFEKYDLNGFIAVSDQYVSREDGYVPLCEPMYRYANLFYREFYEPVPITNTSFLYYLTDPSTRRSVSLSTFLDIYSVLYAFNKEVDDEFFCVADQRIVMDFSKPETLNSPQNHAFQGRDGCALLSFILFTDAVDAALEITFKKTDPKSAIFAKPVSVKIVAYYGDEIGYSNSYEKGHYYISIFLDGSVTLLDNTKIQLQNSVFAVPTKGSLIIDAFIGNSSAKVIMNDLWKFGAKQEGSSTGRIKGTDCSLDLKMNWKY